MPTTKIRLIASLFVAGFIVSAPLATAGALDAAAKVAGAASAAASASATMTHPSWVGITGDVALTLAGILLCGASGFCAVVMGVAGVVTSCFLGSPCVAVARAPVR